MSDVMTRLNAALSDRYELKKELGEGGMATVYLAEDLKHDRQVAIKVLKPELAAVIGGDRFVTEIKTTAALQHPHILPLFDSGAADGFLYYVMPYVDGESLREKLDREKQLGVEEAVKIGAAVASALHYAHEQGIVHRDIKPANILLHAGEPVVADFGIALAISAAAGGRLTETGMSVGTPHYMSPEQASADRDVSARSDIYSLACVVYEMLTGDPPHTGPTAQVVLMRILTEEPRMVGDVRRAVPDHVQGALAKGLEKLPADRFKSADEFKRALTDPDFTYRPRTKAGTTAGIRSGGGEDPDAPSWAGDTRTRILLGACVLLLALAGWGLARGSSGSGDAALSSAPVYRYVIHDSLKGEPISLDISSRGDVAYAGAQDGTNHLRLRRAADTLTREIPGTAGGQFPVFSPDAEWIAFMVRQQEILKVQLATGTRVTLVPEEEGITLVHLGQWTEDGDLIFSGTEGIYRVPDVGGTPEKILQTGLAIYPQILPNGRTLVYTDFPNGQPGQVSVIAADLTTGDTATIVPAGGNAAWSPTGHILHGHPSGTLFALPFDLDRREVTGTPVPVREGVFGLGAVSLFAFSPPGQLVYLTGEGGEVDLGAFTLSWMDMDGEYTVIPLEPTDHADARVSPDGSKVAYTRDGQVFIFDLELGTNQRFTFGGGLHHDPVWSPDGTRLAFSSDREGGQGSWDVYLKDVDGRTEAQWLTGGEGQDYASDWLEDGTIVGYDPRATGAAANIWMVQVSEAGSEPTYLLQADWDEAYPHVSPDGRWMAYLSDETGEPHIFVREFPGMGGRWQVSEVPVADHSFDWAPDGSALYFQNPDGSLVRADLQTQPTFRVVNLTTLTGPGPAVIKDLDPRGRGFLVGRPQGVEAFENVQPKMMVAANWLTELRERLGAGERR